MEVVVGVGFAFCSGYYGNSDIIAHLLHLIVQLVAGPILPPWDNQQHQGRQVGMVADAWFEIRLCIRVLPQWSLLLLSSRSLLDINQEAAAGMARLMLDFRLTHALFSVFEPHKKVTLQRRFPANSETGSAYTVDQSVQKGSIGVPLSKEALLCER